MQVIGLSRALENVDAIAFRATSSAVAEWVRRVVPRHIRRTRDLHVALPNARAVRSVAASDGLSSQVTDRIIAAMKAGEEIVTPHPDRINAWAERALDTMDFMASLPEGDRRIRRIERLSWLDAEKMSEDWHAALARKRSDTKDMMAGVVRIADFDDGTFVAELVTQHALKAEGDAMGHCVGGYWSHVSGGRTRIVSLRDASGEPHVTIELGRLEKVDVEGMGLLSLMHGIAAGANDVLPPGVEWFARQIRGKQNRVPVEKYAHKVRSWLSHARLPSKEHGFVNRIEDEGFSTVYAIPKTGSKEFELTTNAHLAFCVASELARGQLRDNPLLVNLVSSRLRLASIARDVADGSRVEAFLSELVVNIVTHVGDRSGGGGYHVLGEIKQSGLEQFVIACLRDRTAAARIMADLYCSLAARDGTLPLESRDMPVIDNPTSGGLVARVHELPCVGLSMMSAGKASGMEDRILNGMEPKLARIIEDMKARSDIYHVIRPSVAGVKPDEIAQAFFACGLGQEFVKASSFVRSGVRTTIKALNTELKALRLAGRDVNLEKNLLGDGYEQRIERLIADRLTSVTLVIGPEPARPMSIATRPIARVSPIKSYALPRR